MSKQHSTFFVSITISFIAAAIFFAAPKICHAAPPPQPTTVDAALDLAQRTLEYVQQSRSLPGAAARLADLKTRADRLTATERSATKPSGDTADALRREILALRREIIFAHPALDFDRLLVNKCPGTLYSHNCDQYLGRHSRSGPGPVIIENWKSPDRLKENILLDGKMPLGAYSKPKLHWHGDRIVFAFCDHTEPQKENRRFFIWECAADGSWVRQLTGTGQDPLDRWGDRVTSLIEDGDPCYLPDSGVAFVSTRCQGFGRCHNGRYTPALLLYRCDEGGENIRQISWSEANETDPAVLHDGRIVYTRWEYINRNVTKFHMLWTTRPDGTGAANFYGNATEDPWMISSASVVPDSDKIFALATGHHTYSTGCVVRIDPSQGENYDQPMLRVTPEVGWLESEKLGQPGSYATPYALNDTLCLTAYTEGKLGGQGRAAHNDYAIYLIDTLGGRELIYRDPNCPCFSPTPIVERPVPPIPAATAASGDFCPADNPTGVLTVQDVHLTRNAPEGRLAPGQIKALRINELINQPAVLKNGGAQPSLIRHEIPKKILGTVPVCEDGSVSLVVPARVPLQIQALDAEGKSILTMRSLIYLQPDEYRSCVGCHEAPGTSPLRRQGIAATRPPVEIRPDDSTSYATGFSYPRSVQPVWDRYCIDCHGLSDDPVKNGGIDLTGTLERSRLPKGFMRSDPGLVPRSYNTLFDCDGKSLLGVALFKNETNESKPCDYFAAASRLIPLLTDGKHYGVKLDDSSLRAVIGWLDLNAQCYGDFSWNRVETCGPNAEGEKALRSYLAEHFGAEIATQPYHTLVNVGRPQRSRALLAATSEKAGGWGQWKTKDGKPIDRIKLLRLIEASIEPQKFHDIAGTCGRTPCICKSCWVREAEAQFQAKLEEQKKENGESTN